MHETVVRTAALATKEAREILRDPVTLWISVLLPLVMMYLFSKAITLDVRELTLAVIDEDNSAESRAYVALYLRSDYFRQVRTSFRAADAERFLDDAAARMVLVVPRGFARNLRRTRGSMVQVLLDGSFPNTAIIALEYADAITERYTRELQRRTLERRIGALPDAREAIQVETRVLYNPALRSENFIIPGLFAVILLAFPPLLTALAVVRERERGSIEQLLTSPVKAVELFAGKLLPYALIAFVEMLLLLGAAVTWFAVPVRGSVALLLSLSVLYVLASCGIGLVVSTWTRSQVVALLLSVVLTFMPALLFSGFMFSIESMPEIFQVYTYFFPGRYFTEISRGIVLKGFGVADLWVNAMLLLGYTLVLFCLVAVRFRKQER